MLRYAGCDDSKLVPNVGKPLAILKVNLSIAEATVGGRVGKRPVS